MQDLSIGILLNLVRVNDNASDFYHSCKMIIAVTLVYRKKQNRRP